jgi:hypothetical protein
MPLLRWWAEFRLELAAPIESFGENWFSGELGSEIFLIT